MEATDLELLEFTDASLKSTEDAWQADVKSGLAFPSETDRLLEWAGCHREIVEGDSVAFGVFQKNKKGPALAICEVIITRHSARSKWVKMLKLNLRPTIDDALQKGDPTLAMNVFIAAMSGSMGLQLAHKATTLKVYGRTHIQLLFLRALVDLLQRHPLQAVQNKIKARIEGRYLTLNFN